MRRPKPPQSYRGLLTKIVNRTKLDRQDVDYVLRSMLANGADIVPASKPENLLADRFIEAYEPEGISHQKRTARRANLAAAWSAFSDFSPYYDEKGDYSVVRRRFIRRISAETGMAQNQVARIINAIRESGALIAPKADIGLDMAYAFLEAYHRDEDFSERQDLELHKKRLQKAWQQTSSLSRLQPPNLTENFNEFGVRRKRRRNGMHTAKPRPRAPAKHLSFMM